MRKNTVMGALTAFETIGNTPEDVVHVSDPEWDETVIDFSDPEYLTATQTDDFGNTHTIVLSHEMVLKFRPHLLAWITANKPL